MGIQLGDIQKIAGDEIARPAGLILGELTKQNVNPNKVPMETILILDHSGSMSDEYQGGLVQRAAERALAFAATVDPDGKAQGIYFDSHAHEAPEIDLYNYHGWVERTRPRSMGSTNLADAIAFTMKVAARTLQVPAIADLVNAPVEVRRRGFLGRSSQSALPAIRPVQGPRPVFALLITDGEPDSQNAAKQMLIRASYAPIFFKILFVSNDRGGRAFLQELDDMDGRYIDNADTVYFTDGLGSVTDEDFATEVVRELPVYLSSARSKNLLAA